MDNLGSHKANAVRRAIRAAGARLFYLPQYSPDLNPIEQFVAKLKHWLRKAAQRTTEAVYDAIAPILDTVSPPNAPIRPNGIALLATEFRLSPLRLAHHVCIGLIW